MGFCSLRLYCDISWHIFFSARSQRLFECSKIQLKEWIKTIDLNSIRLRQSKNYNVSTEERKFQEKKKNGLVFQCIHKSDCNISAYNCLIIDSRPKQLQCSNAQLEEFSNSWNKVVIVINIFFFIYFDLYFACLNWIWYDLDFIFHIVQIKLEIFGN